jgi:6-phosphogluconolactonase (cycloisomerase 2 family)
VKSLCSKFRRSSAFDQSRNFLYVTNNSSNTISGFAVDPITGNLTPLAGSPFTAIGGNGPAWIAVDPTNQYMYVANEGTNTVGVLAIGPDGELTLKYLQTGVQPLSIVLVK